MLKKVEAGHRVLLAGKLAKGTSLRKKGQDPRRPIGVVVKIRKGVSLGTAISISTEPIVRSEKDRSGS